jgi:hypothetical protein
MFVIRHLALPLVLLGELDIASEITQGRKGRRQVSDALRAA